MTDEFTARLMAKRNPQAAAQAALEARRAADPGLDSAARLLETRAAELRGHGPAIAELLTAVTEVLGRLRKPSEPEATPFGVLMLASRQLRVDDCVIARCVATFYGADPAEIPADFTFNDMLEASK